MTIDTRQPATVDSETQRQLAWFVRLRWLAIAGLLVTLPAAWFVLHLRFHSVPLLAVAAGTVVLTGAGFLGGRLFGYSRFRGMALALNCMVGFPFGTMIATNVLASVAKDESQRGGLESDLIPQLDAGSILVTNVISIFLASLVGGLL